MPFQVDVSKTDGIARVTAAGRIELNDVHEYVTRARKMGLGSVPALIDATRAEAVGVSTRDLLAVARLAMSEFQRTHGGPRAIIVSSRRHFEWARTFAGLVAGWMCVGVFTDRREALLWLEHQRQRLSPEAARRAANG